MTTKKDPLVVRMPDNRAIFAQQAKEYWEELLTQNPSIEMLIQLIQTTEHFAMPAFEELLKIDTSNVRMVRCLHSKDKRVVAKAGELVLMRTDDNNNLAQLVNWGMGNIPIRAWRKLEDRHKESKVTNETWRKIVESSCHNVEGYDDRDQYRRLAASLLFENSPANSDLISVMVHCDDDLAKRATKLFVGQNPTNGELQEILRTVSHDGVVRRAMAILLNSKPTNDELVVIITTHSSSGSYQRKALEKLLQSNPTKHELSEIIYKAQQEFKDQVWEKFLEFEPSGHELLSIMDRKPGEGAKEILRRPNPSHQVLQRIVEKGPEEYKEAAARILLENINREGLELFNLQLIYKHVKALRAEVKPRLPKMSAVELVANLYNLDSMY